MFLKHYKVVSKNLVPAFFFCFTGKTYQRSITTLYNYFCCCINEQCAPHIETSQLICKSDLLVNIELTFSLVSFLALNACLSLNYLNGWILIVVDLNYNPLFTQSTA